MEHYKLDYIKEGSLVRSLLGIALPWVIALAIIIGGIMFADDILMLLFILSEPLSELL